MTWLPAIRSQRVERRAFGEKQEAPPAAVAAVFGAALKRDGSVHIGRFGWKSLNGDHDGAAADWAMEFECIHGCHHVLVALKGAKRKLEGSVRSQPFKWSSIGTAISVVRWSGLMRCEFGD
jgi:hypothetical protein